MDLVALSNGLHGSVQMDSVALFSWIGWLRHHGIFKKANCTVTYLQRIEFGPLKLNDLPLGEFRALSQEELDALKG